MRLLFVGSLDANNPDLTQIVSNLSQLVLILAKHHNSFVIRDADIQLKEWIPIDHFIYNSLLDHVGSSRINLDASRLTLVREINVSGPLTYTLPNTSYSIGETYRIDFYRELLSLADIIIGVGGQHGLLRLTMICEWLKKPVFLLPGSGGVADLLWGDYFTKFYQIRFFSEADRRSLRTAPFINRADSSYGETIYELIRLTYSTVDKNAPSSTPISMNTITLAQCVQVIPRLAASVWLVLLSLIASGVSGAYGAGKAHLMETLWRVLKH